MRKNPARLVAAQVRIKARAGGGIFTSEPYHADDSDAAIRALSKLRGECMSQGIDFDDARSMKQIDVEAEQRLTSEPQSRANGVLACPDNGVTLPAQERESRRSSQLDERLRLSPKDQAILLISEEITRLHSTAEDFCQRHTAFKTRWNHVTIDYPSDTYIQFMAHLKPLAAEGAELNDSLSHLDTISVKHRTGLASGLRNVRAKFDEVQRELETLVRNFTSLKEDEDRKHPPKAGNDRTIHLACYNCQQHIEVNATASGQSFHCPSCTAEITVPGASDQDTEPNIQ